MKKNNNYKLSRGFTVLFASLIGALVLSIGLAILNITLKQNILSSAGRKTQQSFYAADAGVECALFLDRGAGHLDSNGNFDCKLGYFGTPSTTAASGVTVCEQESTNFSTATEYECFGRKFNITIGPNSGGANENTVISNISIKDNSTFVASRNSDMNGVPVFNEDVCFSVDVVKTLDVNTNELTTTFESRGYNTCDESSVNRFERAIRAINN